MSAELVRDMAERLGRSGQEVSKALNAFASAVNDRLQADGEANLAGLGTLRRTNEGYSFEPSEALDQAVNYRWAAGDSAAASGAVELSPNQQSPSTANQDSETDMGDDHKPIRKVSWAPIDEADPTAVTPPTTPKAPPPPPATATPAAAPPAHGGPQPPVAPKQPGAPPAPPTEQSPFDPVAPLVEDLTYETLHQGFGQSPETAKAFSDTTAPPPPAPADAKAHRRTPTRRTGEPSGTPLLLVLAVLVLALVWLFAFGPGRSWLGLQSADPPTAAEQTPPAATPLATTEDSEVTGSEESESETGDDEATTPVTDPPPETPLTLDPDSDGYTIIVGSSLDLQRAQALADSYRSLGLPIGILSYPDADGNLRHRPAVGQYASAQEAEAARESFSDLPDDAWVRRIRR